MLYSEIKNLYEVTGSVTDINTLLINRNEYQELLTDRGKGKVYYESYIEGCNESFNSMMQELGIVRAKLEEATNKRV